MNYKNLPEPHEAQEKLILKKLHDIFSAGVSINRKRLYINIFSF